MELAEAVALVIFYLGAFLMPLVSTRLHIPAAVGEILFGVLIGGSGLALVHENPYTDFLAELGFAFLMFLVGMEIDFNRIERESRRTLGLAVLVAVTILGFAAHLTTRLELPLFMTLVLGAMSVGILMVALVEVGVQQTRWGQLILLVGSVGEFLTLLTLTGYNLVHQFGVGPELAVESAKVVGLFVVALVVLGMLRLVVWWYPKSFQRWVHEEDPSEIGVRFGFVLMLGLSALAAWVGLEAIMGAFLAGMLFSYVFRETGVLETKLAALGQGFFVPIFFINVGVSFDRSSLGDIGTIALTVSVLAAASLLAKLIPTSFLLLARVRPRAVLAGAFLLATPLTLLVAVAAIGLQIGVLDQQMSAAVVLLAIVTAVVFPILFKIVAPKDEPQATEFVEG